MVILERGANPVLPEQPAMNGIVDDDDCTNYHLP